MSQFTFPTIFMTYLRYHGIRRREKFVLDRKSGVVLCKRSSLKSKLLPIVTDLDRSCSGMRVANHRFRFESMDLMMKWT